MLISLHSLSSERIPDVDDSGLRMESEKYELSEIFYIGQTTVKKKTYNQTIQDKKYPAAIVLLPNSKSVKLAEGDYIGKNHGRIKSITNVRIEIIEVVPVCANGGWSERTNYLAIQGSSNIAFQTLGPIKC